MSSLEHDRIVKLIKTKGPCTGLEIKKEIDIDSLVIWKTCQTSEVLQVRTLGKRYLRLDRRVEGFARLSPSILREFFTYSVVGLTYDLYPFEQKCAQLIDRIHDISTFKFELARKMVSEVMDEFDDEELKRHDICFLIAGDIVYDMAHDVPRPERSTGRLVRGSDIDLVVIVEDKLSDTSISRLDKLIYQKKYRMLINPAINEEVDYKIKRLGLIKEQSSFNEFKNMVAMKILQEGLLLFGSENLFRAVKGIVEENGIPEKINKLEGLAERFRNKAESAILNNSLDKKKIREMHLFYSAEEFEEFE